MDCCHFIAGCSCDGCGVACVSQALGFLVANGDFDAGPATATMDIAASTAPVLNNPKTLAEAIITP